MWWYWSSNLPSCVRVLRPCWSVSGPPPIRAGVYAGPNWGMSYWLWPTSDSQSNEESGDQWGHVEVRVVVFFLPLPNKDRTYGNTSNLQKIWQKNSSKSEKKICLRSRSRLFKFFFSRSDDGARAAAAPQLHSDPSVQLEWSVRKLQSRVPDRSVGEEQQSQQHENVCWE